MYPFMTLTVHFDTLIQINHKDLPVNVSTVLHDSVYLFIFMFFFCLTTKTYLSPQLLVYLPIDVPAQGHTCSFLYLNSDYPLRHVHSCTSSSVYLFSLFVPFRHNIHKFVPFRHNIHNYLSTYLLGYVHTDLPENKFTCLSSCFSFV